MPLDILGACDAGALMSLAAPTNQLSWSVNAVAQSALDFPRPQVLVDDPMSRPGRQHLERLQRFDHGVLLIATERAEPRGTAARFSSVRQHRFAQRSEHAVMEERRLIRDTPALACQESGIPREESRLAVRIVSARGDVVQLEIGVGRNVHHASEGAEAW